MSLKMITKTYYEVDHQEVEELIRTHYQRPYDIVLALDAANGTEHAMHANHTDDTQPADPSGTRPTAAGLAPTSREEIHVWLNTGGYDLHPSHLMNDLALKGVIPPGDYRIRVDW